MPDPTPQPPPPDPSSPGGPGGPSDPTAPMPQSPAPQSPGPYPAAPMPPAPGYPDQTGYPPPQGDYPAQGGYPPPAGAYQPGGYPYQPGQPGPAAFGPPPKSRSNRVLIFVALGIALLLLLCGGACVAGYALLQSTAESVDRELAEGAGPLVPSGPRDPVVPPGGLDSEATVVYEVTGDGPASITYTDEAGRPRQLRDVDLPWRTELTVPSRALIMLIAVRGGTDEGAIGCRLDVDGAEVSAKEANGFIASANCSSIGG